MDARDQVKSVIEKNLANFMKRQEAEKGLFTPSNTQYQRLVQKVTNNLKLTEYSPHNEQNLQKQAMQIFGSTSGDLKYLASRDTTLGYFSVKEPFEIGQGCERFTAREEKLKEKAEEAAKALLKATAKISKSAMKETNMGWFKNHQRPSGAAANKTAPSEHDEPSISDNGARVTGKTHQSTKITVTDLAARDRVKKGRSSLGFSSIDLSRKTANILHVD